MMRNILLAFLLSWVICDTFGQVQYLGSPTTTVISRGNFRSDSLFYLPKRSKAPTDTAAIRYQISDSSVYVWTGSSWRKSGGIDTTSLSNRVNLKLNISDTATMLSPYLRKSDTSTMLGNYIRHAGYGLTKSGQSFIVDTLNISTRAWRQKGIDSVAAIRIAGSGTINRSAKFTATGSIGNGGIADSSSSVAMTILSSGNVGVGTQAPSSRLHVSGGDVRIDNTRSYNFTNNSGGTSSARLQMFSDNNLYIDNPDGALNFRTQSFESAMIITNGKNVGIGTTTPSQKLDVLGIITNNSSAYFATSSGNVGIGTTSPSQKLSVNGIGAFNTRLVFNGFNQLVGDGNQFNDGGGISGFGIRNDSGQVMLAAGGNTPQLRVSKSGEILINTNTDAGDYKIQVNGNSLFSGNIRTAAPTGGTANDWRLGTVATVSPTSPNRTIEVSIGGTIYYIHAKTTND